MPIELDERRKPASVKVHVSNGAGVDVTWADGHASHYDFEYMRKECPCATCNDERIKKNDSKFAAPSSPIPNSAALPMFKPKTRARAAKAVGNYALQIDFTDGHTAGIYSFDYLRRICPCAECRGEFRGTHDESSR
jgi:prepilin-type processing-associated H-X9-DG protein